jgi:hypothetical protein
MQTNNFFEKDVSNMNNITTPMTWYEVCHLKNVPPQQNRYPSPS